MTAPPFIDAHLHAWDRRRLQYPWLEGAPAAPVAFGPTDLPSDDLPTAAVFVEAAADPADALAEAAWAVSLGDPVHAVVAAAPVETGVEVGPHLDQLAAMRVVVGVRRVLQDEPDEMLRDPVLWSGLREVGARRLSFDLCVRAAQLPAVVSLVRAAPETVFVLDHLGKPPLRAGWSESRSSAWREALRVLAAEPNVVVKLSGLAAEAGPGPVEPQARPYIETALDAFGAARALIGSDWPVSRRSDDAAEYRRWFDFIADGFGLDPAEQRQVAIDTAVRTYRLETPQER